MTREQAIEVLKNRYCSGVTRSKTNDDEWRLATYTAISALRGPQPDYGKGIDVCITCGGYVPEGYMVCVNCRSQTGNYAQL